MDMRDTQTKHPGWQGKWETLGSISMFPGGCLVLHPSPPLLAADVGCWNSSPVRGEPTQNYPKNEFQRAGSLK